MQIKICLKIKNLFYYKKNPTLPVIESGSYIMKNKTFLLKSNIIKRNNIIKMPFSTVLTNFIFVVAFFYIGSMSFATTALVPRILDIVFPLNTSRSILLPYPAYYFVDEEQYFYYIFCHMFITAALSMTGFIAHDCMFFAYVEHVCGLFAVIG